MYLPVVLVAAVVAVGILHTMVPDHWLPIAVMGRRDGWSRGETARAALVAGTGHVLSTLAIGLVVWIAGAAFAQRFGGAVAVVSSLALVAFGGWIAVGAIRELHVDRDRIRHDHVHGGTDHRDHGASAASGASSRTALLLILGSSPMVEGLPAFFAAGRYGFGLIAVMSVAFACATILTYVTLCVASTAGLQRLRLGRFERFGEVVSGASIAIVGFVFLAFPSL